MATKVRIVYNKWIIKFESLKGPYSGWNTRFNSKGTGNFVTYSITTALLTIGLTRKQSETSIEWLQRNHKLIENDKSGIIVYCPSCDIRNIPSFRDGRARKEKT